MACSTVEQRATDELGFELPKKDLIWWCVFDLLILIISHHF